MFLKITSLICAFLFSSFQLLASPEGLAEIKRQISAGKYQEAIDYSGQLLKGASKQDEVELLYLKSQAYSLSNEPLNDVLAIIDNGIVKAEELSNSNLYWKGMTLKLSVLCARFELSRAWDMVKAVGDENPDGIEGVDWRIQKVQLNKLLGYHSKANLALSQLVHELQSKATGSNDEWTLRLGKVHVERADVLISSGHYAKADSLLDVNLNWLRSNLGSKTPLLLKNILLYGECEARSEDPELLRTRINKALKSYKKTKPYKSCLWSPDLMRTLAFGAHWEYDKENIDDGSKYQKTLEKAIKSGFGKSSPELEYIQLLEFHKAVASKDLEYASNLWDRLSDESTWLKANTDAYLKFYEVGHQYKILTGNKDEAVACLDKMVQRSKDKFSSNHPVYHLIKLKKAVFVTRQTNRYSVAQGVFNESFQEVVKKEYNPMHDDYLNIATAYAQNCQNLDLYGQARALLKENLNYVRTLFGNDSQRYAEELNSLARVNMITGDFSFAKELLDEAALVFQQYYSGNGAKYDAEVMASIFVNLAKWHLFEGDYKKAEANLDYAQSLVEDENYILENLDELSQIQIQKGQYKRTEMLLEQSLIYKEAKFGKGSKELISSYLFLGKLKFLSGAYTEADQFIEKALHLAHKHFPEAPSKFAAALFVRGQILEAIGDYENAHNVFAEILEIQKTAYGEQSLGLASTMEELAVVDFHFEKDVDRSKDLVEQAVQIIEKNLGENNLFFAEAEKQLSEFYILSHRTEDAQKHLEQAVESIENFSKERKIKASEILEAEIFEIQGSIARVNGDYQEAINKYSKAQRMFKENFSDRHPEYVHATSELAKLYHADGDEKKALKMIDDVADQVKEFVQLFFPSLTEREKAKFWSKMKSDFEFYYGICVDNHVERPELVGRLFDLLLDTKSLLLSSSLRVRQSILQSGNDEVIAIYEKWLEKKERLLSVSSGLGEDEDIEKLTKEIRYLEKELGQMSDAFAESEFHTEWKEVQRALKPNEVAIEVVRFRTYNKGFTDSVKYAFLILTSETKKAPIMVVYSNGTEMEDKHYAYYRNATRFGVPDPHSYHYFWEAVDQYIPDDAYVYLSPDGIYNQMNVSGFSISENRSVVEKNTIVLLKNTKDLAHRKEGGVQYSPNAFLIGNPKFYTSGDSDDGGVQPLPGAEREVDVLSELFIKGGWEAKIYKNDDAHEGIVKEIQNPSPGIIHIATHGYFSGDGNGIQEQVDILGERDVVHPMMKSGLLLKSGGSIIDNLDVPMYNSEPGILTALEAMNLTLDKTEIVVLSACETGRGQITIGEGVYGLQRAFLVAGANSVIMSLFKVSDEITAEFMELFYKRWLETGDKRASFRNAQLEIKKVHPEVIYWGAFVMVEA